MIVYTARFFDEDVLIADGDVDLFELTLGDDTTVTLLGWRLFVLDQVGDTTEDIIPIQLISGHTANGTGGVVTTPRQVQRRLSAVTAITTVDVNQPGIATGGTVIELFDDGFNNRVGSKEQFTDDERFVVDQSDTSLILRMKQAIVANAKMSGCIWFGEG